MSALFVTSGGSKTTPVIALSLFPKRERETLRITMRSRRRPGR